MYGAFFVVRNGYNFPATICAIKFALLSFTSPEYCSAPALLHTKFRHTLDTFMGECVKDGDLESQPAYQVAFLTHNLSLVFFQMF